MRSGTELTTVKFQAEPASSRPSRQLASGSAQDEVVVLELLYVLLSDYIFNAS